VLLATDGDVYLWSEDRLRRLRVPLPAEATHLILDLYAATHHVPHWRPRRPPRAVEFDLDLGRAEVVWEEPGPFPIETTLDDE
jgi:hypothetical protein